MGIFKRRERRPTEAEEARRRAEERLEEVRAETPLYAALASSLADLRRRNHFADSIADSFRGRP